MSERSPGFEDYIPSRLEWLTVMLNSLSPYMDTLLKGKISRLYLPKNDGKTLLLMVSYPKDIESSELEDIIKRMVEYAKTIAEINNWSSWLEIEVERHPE